MIDLDSLDAAQTFLLNDRHILKMRLNSLCEIKPMCFDLAQRLAAVVWKYYRLQNSIMTFLPEDELHYILDLYLVLLVNLKQHNVVIDQVIILLKIYVFIFSNFLNFIIICYHSVFPFR